MSITVTNGVVMIASEGEDVLTLQRVGEIVYLDLFDTEEDAKAGKEPTRAIQIDTRDMEKALEELGLS